MTVVKLVTKHDVNGNPRRVWIIMDSDTCRVIAAVPEGYEGRVSVVARLVQLGAGQSAADSCAFNAPQFEITPREYRRVRKDYPR